MNIAAVTSKLAIVGGPKVQLMGAKIGKYSPQILTAVGLAGGITSTFLIAKASTQLEPLLDRHEQGKNLIDLRTIDGDYESQKERSKEIRVLYVRSGLDLVKLYWPGISLGTASVISIVAAQGISQKRQVAMVAAIKSAESALTAYRARVVSAIGEEKEAEAYYGISTETIEDENGKKTKVKVYDANAASGYQIMFDENNRNWETANRELNYLFLKNVQNWSNDRLNSRGFVYLNEVYALLGIPEVPAGQVVGWLHKDFDNGDGYIDFGWENPVNRQQNKFGEGLGGILLDFNVDGEINSKL